MKNKSLNFNKFSSKNKKDVIKKITSFQKQGKGKIHIVLDFDKTLVRGKKKKGQNITVWDAMEKFDLVFIGDSFRPITEILDLF